MGHSLRFETKNRLVLVTHDQGDRHIKIFAGHPNDEGIEQIATFDISNFWDMLRDSLISLDIGPIKDPGLFRRKAEAAAGILETCRTYERRK